MTTEQCALCIESSTPWEFVPDLGHICEACAERDDGALNFQRHHSLCWQYLTVNGMKEICLYDEACEECNAYDKELK